MEAVNTSLGALRLSRITSTGVLPAHRAFFTFTEATLFAQSVAKSAVGKPRVKRDGLGWLVCWEYRPVLINGAA